MMKIINTEGANTLAIAQVKGLPHQASHNLESNAIAFTEGAKALILLKISGKQDR